MNLKVQKLFPDAQLPTRGTERSAGLDLYAYIPHDDIAFQFRQIHAGQRVFIMTGLAIELPPGHEGQIRPRSGLACKRGLTVANSPGTIDEDYRGEIVVVLINTGHDRQIVQHGERIAQLVVAPVTLVEVVEVNELAASERGGRGFGSTGR